MGLLPQSATPDASLLLASRGLRAFGDGFIAIVLPAYLLVRGFEPFEGGVLATATLLGSSALTLLFGLLASRYSRKRLLGSLALLMAATGVAFALLDGFWPLLLVAFGGSWALAVILWTEGTRLVTAAESGLLGSAEVPFAVLFGWLILAEIPPAASVAGGAIVLLAVFCHAAFDLARRQPHALRTES